MGIYYFACLASVLMAFAFNAIDIFKKKGVLRDIAALVSSAPLLIMAAVRYGIGTDYSNYERLYRYRGKNFDELEILYKLINVICDKLNMPFQCIIIVCAVIFMFFIYKHIFDESPYPTLSIFLLVGMIHYFAFLNVMRQLIGVAILLFGIRYIERKNFFKFLLCVLIAAGFHISCLVFIVLYWYDKIKLSSKDAIILTVLVAVLGNIIIRLLIIIINLFGYGHYFGSRYDTGNVKYMYVLVQLAVFALALIMRPKSDSVPKEVRKNKFLALFYDEDAVIISNEYQIYFVIQLLNLWISFFSGGIPMIDRLRYMFGLPSIILIPLAVKNVKNRMLRILLTTGLVVCFVIYSYMTITEGYHEVLPYRTIFDK